MHMLVDLFNLRNDKGQMAVELVVLIPVILIVAGILANLIGYFGQCARFDKVCAEAVRVYGVSPGYGEYGRSASESNITNAIDEAFAALNNTNISVSSTDIGILSGDKHESNNLVFSLEPKFRKFTCSLEYNPPFFSLGVFGTLFPPLRYEKSFVVDPYEPTGWM